MKIIYVHGFESSAESTKGRLLQDYCTEHYPNIKVLRPDLNMTPEAVLATLCQLVENCVEQGEQAVVVGSSLGGYFSTLVSNATGCDAVLLNPSTQPHISLQRLLSNLPTHENLLNDNKMNDNESNHDVVVHQTSGGWDVTLADLEWFDQHRLKGVEVPDKMYVIIKAGDELLDPMLAKSFYESQGVIVDWQSGGDHRMSDFADQLPEIMQRLKPLLN